MLKILLGLIVGVVAAFATVFVLEWIAHQIFPGVRVEGPVPSPIPVGMQLFVLAAYVIASAVGGLVGGRIADRRWVAWAVAIVVTAAAVATIFMVDQAVWMQIASVVAPLAGGFIATHLLRGRSDATPAETGDAAL